MLNVISDWKRKPAGLATPADHARRSADDYPPLQDLAAIGDGHSVALLSRAGTIEWWCPVRFDHPSVFASILDRRSGGRFDLLLDDVSEIERTYVDHTNILRTVYRTATGTLEVLDFMPLVGDARELRPHHGLMRRLRCTAGRVSLHMRCLPRFQYGRIEPRVRRLYQDTLRFFHGSEVLILRTDARIEAATHSAQLADIFFEGDVRWVSLSYSDADPAVIPPVGQAAEELLASARAFWEHWSAQCAYRGPYREALVRSALVLKMLLFAPSGALVAAPTTSLPEEIGGVRNWDYRYCWLRDASLAVRALMKLGYVLEAHAYLGWMLHATYLTWPSLQVAFDVYGRANIPERELPHLEGYRGSSPVRDGNDAAKQFQLDAYAEVISAAHEYEMSGGELSRGQMKHLAELGDKVIELWREPDKGIWEFRSDPQHHVHSKVMCWRALDNLVNMHRLGQVDVPIVRYRQECERIRADVERNGFDESLNSYVQAYGSRIPDASLLVLPIVGYIPADHPRMQGTFAYLKEHLESNGLWYRYPPGEADGLPGREGTFGICSFLAVEALARAGRVQEATSLFEHLLTFTNDVGLYGEEIDAETGAALGNYPQAFTHIGLINAAISLEQSRDREQ